ncbi:MAG: transglutaminase-like domain-containing protein [Myxococcota bacterium]|nr:transglutaminase-like domain-containing protein [Myxococcota bacterium]
MSEGENQVWPGEWMPDRPGFDRYLEDTIVIDWQTPSVLERAREFGKATEGEENRVRAAFLFVRDEIAQSLDDGTDELPCSASQVLKAGTGLSYAKSHLLAALLRASGVPVGFGYQRVADSETLSGTALHGFVVVWFSSLERWIALDPRGDNESLHSDFGLGVYPEFAHEPQPEKGEVVFPVVLARPLKVVVDLLDRGESLSRVRRHLPVDLGP